MPKMAHFLISYDLRKQRNYQPLWEKLDEWGAVRLLESLWVVAKSANAAKIRDEVRIETDSDDAVVVLELKTGSDWATFSARDPGINWLKRNIQG
jgi:hypothetical protein